MEIEFSKDGSCSAFRSMKHERFGKSKRNYHKPVNFVGLVVDGTCTEEVKNEINSAPKFVIWPHLQMEKSQ